MKKFIPVLLGSLFTLGAYAQGSATMDGANQTIINTCRSEGGTFISFKDDKCEYSGCAYVGTNGEVNYNGDNERVQGGCSIAEYRNKARNQYKSELDKKIADAKAQRDKEIADLEKAKKEADRIGSAGRGRDKYDINGDGVVDSKDDLNGDGVVDDKDLEEAARRIGAAQSGSGSGVGGGKGDAGAGSGSGSGSNSGTTIGADGAIYCEELEGNGSILPGGACYNECKPKRSITTLWLKKKEGLDRKSCVECLYNNQHIYKLKAEYLPKDKNGRTIGDRSVNLGAGVRVKTGVIICKDSKGNIVSATSNGTCPSGTVLHTTTGAGGGGSTIIVGGGAGVTSGAGIGGGVGGSISIGGGVGSGTGGVSLPSYCNSPKQKDIDKCNDWMQQNRRFLCSSSSNVSACLGGAESEIYARYNNFDCVNCGSGRRQQSTLSGIAEIAGAVMPGIAQLGSAYMGSRAYTKSNQAWANAAKAGFEQCRLSQNDYMQYLQANELPALTPAQQQGMNCNGYSLNGFAGLGGGLGGYYGSGYTAGLLGGLMGQYGMYNPYGMGVYIVGSMGGLATGFTGGGYFTGGNIGLATGIVGGGGYISGGYMNGGYMSGGYMNGGYMSGGYMTGGYMTGGYMNGGYMSGGYMTGGGGFINGVSIAGGVVSGYMNGGYAQGGYMTGGVGIAGGGYMNGGYMAGGYAQGGYMAGGYAQGGYMAGGYAQGGYMAGGYAQGGYMAGGYMNGGYMAGGMGMGNDLGLSQQASNYDRMLQQQGTMYQMQNLGGSAGYYPSNMGMGLGFNANLGFGAY